MSAIRILVAEDHPAHAAKMEMLLSEAGYDLIAICDTSVETLRLFKATKPDLVILDIELSQGGNGIDIAEKIAEHTPTPIIFATSFEDRETISTALNQNPYAYLVKPIEKGSLQAAVELAIYKFGKSADEEGIENEKWPGDVLLNDCFFVKAGDQLVKLPVEDILWIELAEDRYCDIVTKERRYHLRTSLKMLEQKLDHGLFVRIHRSKIVNVSKIESIGDADNTVKMQGHEVVMGKTFKNALIKRLKMLQ